MIAGSRMIFVGMLLGFAHYLGSERTPADILGCLRAGSARFYDLVGEFGSEFVE